ncbi:MAG TPA: XrtA/PEP-CTERM system exopolysaccharide export protein [Gammaproteobacteria bacterium]|nr:XrtA/PEP-CTERM system exopolysaccharide export protein [Gammaproteobacteria bacterium]
MDKKKFFLASLILSMLVLLGGCASAPPANLAATPAPSEYQIGPGDTLQIYVRNNPNLSVTIPVRPDGRISMPMVQNMEAAGKTPSQLAHDLEQALSRYIREPTVTVMVTRFVGAYSQQIRVIGQAVHPETIPYRSGMTLLDVMIRVGGLTPVAAGNRATLVRKVKGKEKEYRVHLKDLLQGNIQANAPVRPGDILIIPEAYF